MSFRFLIIHEYKMQFVIKIKKKSVDCSKMAIILFSQKIYRNVRLNTPDQGLLFPSNDLWAAGLLRQKKA